MDQRFSPSNITIPMGAEVTWINEDESEHTVTSGNVAIQVQERIYDGILFRYAWARRFIHSHI